MNDGAMKVLAVVIMVATLGFMAWGVMHHIEDDHRKEWRHQQRMNQRYHQRTWSEKWSDWWNGRDYDHRDRYRNDPYRNDPRYRHDPYRYRSEEDYWRRRYDPYYRNQNGCER